MHYSWQDTESIVHDVEFITPHKQQEALIYAPRGATRELLQRIPEMLRHQGYVATPDMVKGEHVLRVEGFGERSALLHTLQQTGFTRGAYETKATEYDHKEPKSLKELFDENVMRLSGAVYLAGDVLLMRAGVRRGDMAELATGAIWGSTGVVLTFFGKKDPDIQAKQLYAKLNDHLKQENFDFSQDEALSLEKLAGKQGLVSKLQKFLYDHPVEFNNTLQGVGGTMMIKAGMNQKNAFKTAAGVSVAAGQWSGMLVDAQKPKENAPKPAMFSWQWFKEKPLRLTGVGATVNNILNLAGIYFVDLPKNKTREPGGAVHTAYTEMLGKAQAGQLDGAGAHKFAELQHEIDAHEGILRDSKTFEEVGHATEGGKDAWRSNRLAAACYIVANGLYGMSSKDTSVSLKDLGKLDEMYAVAAQVIGSQDAQMQPELTQRIAGFLAGQADIKETPQEIADIITQKVRSLGDNPWAGAPKVPGRSVQGATQHKAAAFALPVQVEGSLAVH